MEYDIKKKHFYSPLTLNFIPLSERNNNKDFYITMIYSNSIILNNINNKILYMLEKIDDIYLIRDKYDYYSNVFNIRISCIR